MCAKSRLFGINSTVLILNPYMKELNDPHLKSTLLVMELYNYTLLMFPKLCGCIFINFMSNESNPFYIRPHVVLECAM